MKRKTKINSVIFSILLVATFLISKSGMLQAVVRPQFFNFQNNIAVTNSSGSEAGYVRVCGTKLCLNREEFFVKGVNYSGGRYIEQYDQRDGYEIFNRWQIYKDFQAEKIEQELVFLQSSLGINTIRIFTPHIKRFDNWRHAGWEPWYLIDGSINPYYLEKLKTLLDLAGRHGIKVQLELFHEIESLVNVDDKTFINPGSPEEIFCLKYLESLIPELKDNKAILSYEISNETLKAWTDRPYSNYFKQNQYDKRVLSFIKRMITKIRELDQNHLITSGEIISPLGHSHLWHWPTPELALIEDVDNLNNGKAFSLYELVDYISPHFYRNEGEVEIFEIIKSMSKKPVVLGEFSYGLDIPEIKIETDKRIFANEQKVHFEAVIGAVAKYDLSGLLPWDPLPLFNLEFGKFEIRERSVGVPNIIIQGLPERKIRGYYSYPYELFYHDLIPSPAAVAFKGLLIQKYFKSYGGSICNDISDERCVNGGDDNSDIANCSDDDCVYNGICYKEGIFFSLKNNNRISGWCMTSDNYKGHWRDCDDSEDQCSGGCKADWTKGGEVSQFGEYDTGSETECCGDDDNEFFITANGKSTCCNNSEDILDNAGNCVSNTVINQPDKVLFGDFDGDNLRDKLSIYDQNLLWRVKPGNSAVDSIWLAGWGVGNQQLIGDFNGDRKDDVLLISHETDQRIWSFHLLISNGSKFKVISNVFQIVNSKVDNVSNLKVCDYDGNGAWDITAWFENSYFCLNFDKNSKKFIPKRCSVGCQ